MDSFPNDEIPKLESAEIKIPTENELNIDPERVTNEHNESLNNDPTGSNENDMETIESNPYTNTIKAETIEINLSTKDIGNNLQPQPRKNWRFHLKNSNDALTKELKSILNNITVEYNIKKESPDIILKQGDDVLGKINLLLCDRRHINEPANYYCKIHLFEFKPVGSLFETVKDKLINFFNKMKSKSTNNSKPPKNNTNNPTNPNSVGGRYRKSKRHRTHKKKRVLKRKKTMKRK